MYSANVNSTIRLEFNILLESYKEKTLWNYVCEESRIVRVIWGMIDNIAALGREGGKVLFSFLIMKTIENAVVCNDGQS